MMALIGLGLVAAAEARTKRSQSAKIEFKQQPMPSDRFPQGAVQGLCHRPHQAAGLRRA
ncbi:MAG: hypothetical protein HY854_08415 [Burkholderiales bacterium]|nr:hypothetical protein [Burkholderiales bacterium]